MKESLELRLLTPPFLSWHIYMYTLLCTDIQFRRPGKPHTWGSEANITVQLRNMYVHAPHCLICVHTGTIVIPFRVEFVSGHHIEQHSSRQTQRL